MDPKDKDTTWKGKKYLEHVGEFQQVIRPSSRDELDRLRSTLERFTDRAEVVAGEFRAAVLSDTGKTTEFAEKDQDSLWEKLSAHLLTPEAKWLEFTVFQPSITLSGVSEFTFKNPNISTQTFETDGTSLRRNISVPLKKGDPLPVFEKPSLVEWLIELKANCSVPLPFEFGDNYYSEEELRERGIHDYEAFDKHWEETWEEERFHATITDRDGAEIWSAISNNEATLNEELSARWEPKAGQTCNFGRLNREVHPKMHPLEEFRIKILSDVTHALEVVEKSGEDSPIVEVLELGIRLSTTVEAMKSRACAHETLKNPNRKVRPAGMQKHESKTKKTENLKRVTKEIIRKYEKAGNSLKPREVVRKLKALESEIEITEENEIKHRDDEKGLSLSNFPKRIIPKLRKEVLAE